jgi:OFA family oxalate/formate antiporter-like MFS transporter
MLTQGSVYAFSALFAHAIGVGFGVSPLLSIAPFLTVTFFIAAGEFTGGLLMDKIRPKAMATAGTVAWAIGTTVAGVGTFYAPSLIWLILAYGVVGGFGAGIANIATVRTVIGWYPKCLGLGSGLALAGFGFGATVYSLVVKHVPLYQSLLARLNTDAGAGTVAVAISTLGLTFMVTGLVFALLAIGGAALLQEAPSTTKYDDLPLVNLKGIVATPDIWVLWMMMIISVGSGLFVLTNSTTILTELTKAQTPLIVGVATYLGLGNGLGRIIFGSLSDRIDRRLAIGIIFGLQFIAITVLTCAPINATFWISTTMIAIVMVSYGGIFGVMPAVVASVVGMQNFPKAYGIVLSGWGIASLTGSAGAIFARGYPALTVLSPICLMMCIAIIFPYLISLRTTDQFALAGKSTTQPKTKRAA